MIDKSWLQLLQTIAWPLVALVGVIILGPGGLLERLVKIISDSLFGLTRAVSDFKETVVSMKAEINRLTELSGSLSGDFATKVDGVRTQVAATSTQLDEISRKTERLLESGTALLREFVAREVETISVENPGAATVVSSAPPSADARYDGIRDDWDALATKLRSALGNDSDFDGRQIGRFAYRLAHGNRKIKITTETADTIAALHSQFKSFARLHATREQWLTEDVYENFVSAVREAVSKLPG